MSWSEKKAATSPHSSRARAEFLAQFRSASARETREHLQDPADAETFERCKLDFRERETHREMYAPHKELLRLRREDAVFGAQEPRALDGEETEGDDRLLVVNLGPDLDLNPAPEPLLAPPAGKVWQTLWSSEDYAYGDAGTPPLETKDGWRIPGRAAFALRPVEASETNDPARAGDPSEEEEVRAEALREWARGE